MKKSVIICSICLLYSSLLFAQVAINTDGSAPDSAAILDVKSTTQGVLLPRLTYEQRNAIQNPVEGLMIYCTNCSQNATGLLCVYNNGKWRDFTWHCETPAPPVAGIHVAEATQITWNWNPVYLALGYKIYIDGWIDLGTETSYTETGLTCNTTYWRSVTAYNDCGFYQTRTLTESTLPVPFSPAPTEGIHDVSTLTTIIWNWNAVPGAVGYKWNSINDYSSAMNMGTSTSKTETGLACNTLYTRYIWAYDNCGYSTATTLTQTSSIFTPVPPTEGIHVPWHYQIVWNWNSVPGATGYKWSNTNNFDMATDVEISTLKTETGLTCNTPYTRYVWAHNICGEHSSPVTLTQTTIECCSPSITINHVAGNVAPVNKTVTYGIVTDIPGEPLKCWISSNLGADHQATAFYDDTEASAGWYWQFNRMQGFMHDGSIRTPNTEWIWEFSEESDWLSVNDPCTIELGSEWRLPTYAEYQNIGNIGGWTDWNGPWNSALKIHAAGFLYNDSGELYDRGSVAYYWSSSQNSDTYGYLLLSSWYNFGMNAYHKSYGISSRCLND